MCKEFLKNELIIPPTSENTYLFFSKRLIDQIDYWIPSSLLSVDKIDQHIIQENYQLFMDNFSPYLTEKGKIAFEKFTYD